MIELNWTFLVQVVNFLVLMFILNRLLYKPVLKVLDERDERIVGGQQKAKQLTEDRAALFQEYEKKLYAAKVDAVSAKNVAINQAVEEANAIIEASRKKADGHIHEMQLEMAREMERVKKELEPELGSMAASIAQQILGRKVA
ncbi:MAG: ATP synthase F0 subunit B [Desulfomonilia bacterium]|nr:ATP synthase F0 subunit B [Desulfomonilia bacterium]